MALLRKRNETPPGMFTYFQKETEFSMKEENLEKLVNTVRKHREYKGLLPQDNASIQLDIERQICTRLGTDECKPEGPSDNWVPQNPKRSNITAGVMLSLSKAALAFVKSGGELATIEEAQRRADICRKCPLAVPMVGCSCGTFMQVIAASVPEERRFLHDKVCGACSCSLSAKVNLTEEQVRYSNEGRKDIAWPEGVNCWQSRIMAESVSKA